MTGRVRPGDVLQLAEADYKYGAGELIFRVTQVLRTSIDPDWIELRGMQLSTRGQEVAERLALVRVSAINSSRRRPT